MSEDPPTDANVARLLLGHRSALFAYILACVRNRTDAEEILQEVFVVVLTSLPKLAHESEYMPWAREIARRQVLSFFRKSKRPMTYDTELVDLFAVAADRMDADRDSGRHREALACCLERLPQSSRRILAMRYGDHSAGVDEIATQIGRTMSATYGLLKRIRENLRSCVETRMAAQGQHG